jgi:23S rRNA pseudouridine2604 synthase
MTEPLRLAKCVVALAQCSRREAEQYIEGGWVRVDGEVIDEPQFMVTGQQVTLDPEATLEVAEPATILLHKPAGLDEDAARRLISPDSHVGDDRSGVRPLKRHFARLVSRLPLPAEGSGLVVYTQDWRVRRRLEDEGDRIEQELLVEVSGELAPNGLALLNHGLNFNGYAMPPIKVSWQSEHRLRFAIRRMQPSQIGRMCEAVGLRMLSMKRLRIGRLPLARMPAGEWRYAAASERF